MMGIGPNFIHLMIGEEIILSEEKREGTDSEDCWLMQVIHDVEPTL